MDSIRANSAKSCANRSARACSASERWAGDLAAQAGKAALAAWTASSTSPGVDSVKLAMTSPVLGSRTSSVSVEEPATDLPSITFGTVISVMGLPFGVVYLLLGIGVHSSVLVN